MFLDQAVHLNCYNFSTNGNDSDIIDWTLSKNTSNVLEVMPYPYVSDILYRQFNDTHYQWCGPMLMILEYFAKLINVK